MSNKSSHVLIFVFLFSISSAFPVFEKHDHVPHVQTSSASPSNPSSIFFTLKHSLARIFPFQQTPPSDDITPHIKTNQLADQNWQSDPLPLEEQDTHQSSNFTTRQQSHIEPSSDEQLLNEQLSNDDLLHMVTMARKMFQAIERALTDRTKTLSHTTHNEHQNNQQVASAQSDAPIKTRNELSRQVLPDVRLALAQAEQLNKRREMERQAKLAHLDEEQDNTYVDYTEGLPRSAPSYPTRVKLQQVSREHRWARPT